MSTPNPANEGPAVRTRETNFNPERKLFFPPEALPGYIPYWFRGEPGRIAGALRRGWEWVTPEEIEQWLPAVGVGMDFAAESGNTDLGNRVSVPAQEGVGPSGQYLRLYLMKLKKDLWDEDMKKYIENRIEPIVDAFKAGMVGADGAPSETQGDRSLRYVKKGQQVPDMFRKKTS